MNSRYFNQANGYRYSMANCLYEAMIEKILEVCECKPYFFTGAINLHLPQCRRLGLTCMAYYMDNFGNDQRGMTMAKDIWVKQIE